MGKEGGLFACVDTLHTHLLSPRNWDDLAHLTFIAIIHDIKNTRPSQLSTITSYNGLAGLFFHNESFCVWMYGEGERVKNFSFLPV